jgi:nucleotide-binding universal stress UspA family protein
MFPFKKILCPTDFSDPSLCGLRMANEMASRFPTEILVLNVHKPIPQLPTPRMEASDVVFDISAYEKQVAAASRENLASLADSVFTDDVNVRLEVRMGRPADEILQFAAEEGVDAILIATHGRTGLAHIVFGSVAEKVVRHAKCPVLTIHECPAHAG